MQGTLIKMHSRLDNPVQYELPISDQPVALNALLGQAIKLKYTGRIFCVHCNKQIKKTYNQGYCYPCFISLAQCDMCIVKPQTCHYAVGTCREPAWGEQFCFQPHVVYLANSSGIKVGITRQTQIPTRWIDQGAVQALPIFKTQSRHIAGVIEVAIAKHISDKTNWQQMLKSQSLPIDLPGQRDALKAKCETELAEMAQRFGPSDFEFLADEQTVDIAFPVDQYPAKIKSLCLIKTPEVSGVLLGIKGQYLLLDTGVINIRKYTGYEIEFSA